MRESETAMSPPVRELGLLRSQHNQNCSHNLKGSAIVFQRFPCIGQEHIFRYHRREENCPILQDKFEHFEKEFVA